MNLLSVYFDVVDDFREKYKDRCTQKNYNLAWNSLFSMILWQKVFQMQIIDIFIRGLCALLKL